MGSTEFGNLIRGTRERKEIEAFDLAHEIGVAPSTLSKYEKGGAVRMPLPKILKGLSKELGLSQTEMLEAFGYDVGNKGDIEFAPNDPRRELIRFIIETPLNKWNVDTIIFMIQRLVAGPRTPLPDPERSRTSPAQHP